jgi:hypothetical protein
VPAHAGWLKATYETVQPVAVNPHAQVEQRLVSSNAP